MESVNVRFDESEDREEIIEEDESPVLFVPPVGPSEPTKAANEISQSCYLSLIEPKNANEALLDEHWICAIQDELEQFKRNDVWELVPRPTESNIVGTKWIFKNKSDEFGNVARNKARLVAQGYNQVEGIDFEETFAPVARLESIRMLLAIACQLKMKLHQMDLKSAFLNGILQEEIFGNKLVLKIDICMIMCIR
ncbi:uncharacterized mitochondrial protein AtMg00820-like [Humulus lupulus]|uniref:uncharacterized mitochondrial protein AtMg00820-like n=1 Tax=Humulus lupulus TaxID=3486 RepID=UPI002B414F94|nr:uncharacterized mitochondrial protein AtMg00820-like [Humulus lupulus]